MFQKWQQRFTQAVSRQEMPSPFQPVQTGAWLSDERLAVTHERLHQSQQDLLERVAKVLLGPVEDRT